MPSEGRAGDTKNVHVGVPSGPDVGEAITSYAPSDPACANDGGKTCTKDVGDGGEMMEKSAVGVGEGGRVTVCDAGTDAKVPSMRTVSSSLATVFVFAFTPVGNTGTMGAPRIALSNLKIRGEMFLLPV